MQMDSRIILAGQSPNVLGALRAGSEAGMVANQAQSQNALAGLYRDQGANILAGQPQALNALAGLDPAAALGMQAGQLDMQAQRGRMTALANEDKRRIADAAAAMDATEAAKIAADSAEDLRILSMADAASWDQVAQARGVPELVGQFGNRAMVLAQSEEAYKAFVDGAKAPKLNLPAGYTEDPANPGGAMRIPGIETETPQANTGAIDDLRKEYGGLAPVKTLAIQADMLGKVVSAAKDPSAAGDLALIFSFMKILDPNSVVREQEFANAQNAAGVPDQVRNVWNKVLNGERLNETQRADFMNQAFKVYKSAEENVGGLERQYKGIAKTRGLPLDQTIIDYRYSGPISGPELSASGIGVPRSSLPPPDPIAAAAADAEKY